MKTRAAVIHGHGHGWVIEEIDIDPPKAGELVVEWKVAGLCHSDEHFHTGVFVPPQEVLDAFGMPPIFPIVGGHEGAGVVVEVGPGVTTVRPGDHVSASFVPSCGRCPSCARGRSNLCDLGAGTMVRGMITDGTARHFLNGEEITVMAKVGTFAQHMTVAESSVIKVDDDLPFEAVALVSCGVATGWGSATKRAGTEPGDTVVVVGIGGIGINAVQGAKAAGAKYVLAVDPVELKREKAMEMGATHTFASMADALPALAELSWGRMAERVVLTPGELHGHMIEEAMQLTGKGGTCVATAMAPVMQTDVTMNLQQFSLWEKELKGTIFGSLNPRADIPKLLGLYREGQLKLDELVTQRYSLDRINDGYQAMRDGENIRGVVVHG